MNEPLLSKADRESPLWHKIKAHMQRRQDTLRRENDNDRDAEDTAKIRGRIAELAGLIALDAEQPVIKPTGTGSTGKPSY